MTENRNSSISIESFLLREQTHHEWLLVDGGQFSECAWWRMSVQFLLLLNTCGLWMTAMYATTVARNLCFYDSCGSVFDDQPTVILLILSGCFWVSSGSTALWLAFRLLLWFRILRTFSRKYTLTNPINLSAPAKSEQQHRLLTVEDANIHLKTDGNKNSQC